MNGDERRLAWLARDALAGVTVAAYLLPQVMAYAQLAGLPPVAGLWAALPALTIYALLGSSPQLSVGPESTTALMTATVVGPLAGGDPGRYAALCAGLAVVVGLLAAAAWALRLGFVADLLSHPILVGYMAGVAVIMIIGQLEKVSQVPVSGDSLLGEVASFVDGMAQAHTPTLLLTLASLVFLFGTQRAFPRLPGPLLTVVLASAAVAAFDLAERGIRVVGEVPAGLTIGDLPPAGELPALLLPAAGVLVVGYTDNVLTARAFGARHGHQIDANREFLALGAANVGSGLLSGFPVSSSGSRTALADAAGARSQAYSLVAAGVVLLVAFFASGALAQFPTAALGAIVIYAATRLVDIAGIRRVATFRRSELLLAVTAFAGVLVFDILYGIVIAIGVSVLDLLARVARPHDAVLGFVPGLAGMHDIDDYPQAETVPGLLVYRYDSPLFFANAQNFKRRALAAVADAQPAVRWFVLNVEANVEVDITALDALDDVRRTLADRDVVFALARVKHDLLDDLDAFGLTESIGPDRMFPTLPTAVDAYRRWAAETAP
jgi:SulP family sulfate permease